MQAAQASPVAQGPGPRKAPCGQPGAHLSRKRACAALPPLAQQALRTGCALSSERFGTCRQAQPTLVSAGCARRFFARVWPPRVRRECTMRGGW